MFDFQSISKLHIFYISLGYIVLRAAFFYSVFTVLYRLLNHRFGIVKDLPSAKQLKEEKLANIRANLFEVVMLFVVMSSGLIKFHEFTWSRFFITFSFCYLFFEFWFYASHRLIHTAKFRYIHKTHHVSVVTNPLSALTLSLGEKTLNDFGLLIIPCLLSNVVPFVFEGILAYHLYNFYINVLGHSNIEIMPKWFARSLWGKIFVTSTYHSIHHLKGHCNYGLFLTFFDRLFNTYDPHYLKHFEAVTEAQGLTRKEVLLVSKEALWK
jgi:lathosterol oxidase